MKHSSSTVFFHCSLSWAWCSIWVHRRPICCSSCSADLLQLFFGLPRFLFPWGFQKSACLVTLLCGFLSVCPIHFHFFLLIWIAILSSWVFAHRSSLLMVFGHLTPRMLCRQRFMKAWVLPVMFFVTLQASAPYIRTVLKFVLKILSLVCRDIFFDLHTGLSTRNAVLAFPILATTSSSVPPSTAITLPR